jgi:hypothetical protein
VVVGLAAGLLPGCSEEVIQPEIGEPTTLAVAPDTLDFGLEENAAEIHISSTGPDTLHWTVGRGASWVRIAPAAGAVSQSAETLRVTIDRSALESGSHRVPIWIDAGEAGVDTVRVLAEIPTVGTVSGHVFFAGSRFPIAGATVSVEDCQAVTAEDGSFTIAEAPVGRHTIRVRKEGFDDFELSVWIPGKGLSRNLGLTSDIYTHELSGTVQNELESGAERVLVAVLNPDGTESELRTRTAADGTYVLQGIPEGERQIRYAHFLYDEVVADVAVHGAGATHDVWLLAGALPPPLPESGPHIIRLDCSRLRIVWVPRTEATVLGYHVERSLSVVGPYEDLSGLLADPTLGHFEDHTLDGGTYYYRVRTENIGYRIGEPSAARQVGGQSWVLLNDGVGGPLGRTGHVMVYDAAGNRVVFHAGMGCTCDLCGVIFADTWAFRLDDRVWERLGSECPPGHRHNHAGICDEARGRMLIFGGRPGGFSLSDDVWEFDFASNTWREVATRGTRPSARCRHTTIYDPVGDRMILYGGYDGAPVNDVWALDLAEHRWVRLTEGYHGEMDPQPAPRYYHEAVLDPVGYRMIVFGGARYYTWDFPSLADTWAFDLASHTWEPLPSGPPGRHSHVLAYNEAKHCVVLYGGGAEGFQRFEDTWELDLATGTWELVEPDSPLGALVHPEVITDASGAVILFGGLQENRPMARTWAYCP